MVTSLFLHDLHSVHTNYHLSGQAKNYTCIYIDKTGLFLLSNFLGLSKVINEKVHQRNKYGMDLDI